MGMLPQFQINKINNFKCLYSLCWVYHLINYWQCYPYDLEKIVIWHSKQINK